MNRIVTTAGPLAAAAANNIALSQTPSAGALTLNGTLVTGGVAVLDNPRRVLFTFAANETGHNFVVTGTNVSGDVISETVAGTTAGTVATVLSYKTVTSITISANATGALTVGTNGVGESAWVRMDMWALPTIGVQCTVSGTVNYTVQQTWDDPNSPVSLVTPANMTWANCPDLALVAVAVTAQSYYSSIPAFIRVVINSGTGTVTMTLGQAGNVNR